MRGWLVNDRLSCIEGSRTLWHLLLDTLPGLADMTGAPFAILADRIDALDAYDTPDYIIRNAGYFRRLRTSTPTIAFVQDVFTDDHPLRPMIDDVITHATTVVYNSAFTAAVYGAPGTTIPIGVNSDVFHWRGAQRSPCPRVLFVGSTHPVKGYDRLVEIARALPLVEFVVVLKDSGAGGLSTGNMLITGPMPQSALATLMRSSWVGLCTSRTETQHLAGIEMGLCGVPLVTTNVGVYHGRDAGAWGEVVHDVDDVHAWVSAIHRQLGKRGPAVAAEWSAFTEPACADEWAKAIAMTVSSNEAVDAR